MCKIMIVGEAWGKDEEEQQRPFAGASGFALNHLLSMVGISRDDCFLTNVFNLRPPGGNDVANLCGPKSEGIPGRPALSNGKYIRAEYAPELTRLEAEVRAFAPTLIIAFGGTATWALCGKGSITKVRGTTMASTLGPKVLGTFHPAAMLRDYTLRPIILADLDKAKREAEFPEIRRPQRFIHIEPTLDDLDLFEREYLLNATHLSIDVETKGDQITCFGIAPTPDCAIVVPFYSRKQPDGNYWRTLGEEMYAWKWVRRQCLRPGTIRVGQNFLYDTHRLWRTYGIPVVGTDDTMLLHHALQPEMKKGLGFLASLYTDEASWKFMRDVETLKKED